MKGNEKWILFNNVEWKRSWDKWNEPPSATPKAGLHPKKVMLCIWWDWMGVLYNELLPENQTISSKKYCSQLDQLKAALNEKSPESVDRKSIIFHQDNVRPHVSLMTRQKSLQLGWEVLIPPPYSPDIEPSNFHLFWSLQNSLNGKEFPLPGRLKKAPVTGKMEKLWSCLKNGRRQWNKRVNTLFNKVLGEKEKCVCYIYLKNWRN